MNEGTKDMSVNEGSKTVRVLFWHQWLFALNIGFAISYALFSYEGNGNRAIHASKPVRAFLDDFGLLLFRIAPLGTDQPRNVLNRNFQIWEAAFIAVMLGLALVLFLIVRQLAQTSIAWTVLPSMSCLAALAAVPSFWLYIVHATWSIYDKGSFWRTYGFVSALELTSVGLILYLIRKWAVSWSIFAFALHYIFWVIVMGQRSGVPALASIPLSLVFPCSGFVWLLYVRELRLQQTA